MKRFFTALTRFTVVAVLGFGLLLQGCSSEKVSLCPVKVVIFDVGGVLATDILGPKIRELAQKYDKDVALLSEARKKYRPLVDLGQINESEFWRRVLRPLQTTSQLN